MSKVGVLLVNVGTPKSPHPRDVGRYLTEFLLDPHVIDIPAPLRWLFVRGIIVPRRKHASSQLYKKIWTEGGSPLLTTTLELTSLMRKSLGEGFFVTAAMRYGEPSIHSALKSLAHEKVQSVTVVPLYPQFSLAATRSAEIEVKKKAARLLAGVPLRFVEPFYQSESYLQAAEKVSRHHLRGKEYDLALFSFHGLPERQIRKTDVTKEHCLEKETCCDVLHNPLCYRAQSFWTAKALAQRLGIPESKYRVAFQSRLGRTPWIRPYTDEYYRTLPKVGVKRLVVLCPSFVTDCLETLEEVQIRGKEEFLRHGGEELSLIPSLNAEAAWVEGLTQIIRENYQPNT